MILAGIIFSIFANTIPAIFTTSKINNTREIMNNIDNAIQGYLKVNKRLPCPDTDGDGLENRDDNGTASDPTDDSCTSYQENLPFATLGLTSDEDAWKNRLYYGVYEDLIRTDPSSFCSELVGFINNSAATTSEDPGETDKLYVTSRSVSPNQSINMAYIIISAGMKDMDQSGSRFDGFNASAPSYQFEGEERFTDDSYDDTVKTRAPSYLYGKLCIGNQW
jgi:type II secretory pathway pseudopilin PulG